MYPGTLFNWHDNSVITENIIDIVDNSPLYLAVSSFDRGPEELRIVSGREFYNLYGTKMNFDKHGQPALQAANMIDGGARLLVKRLVAVDAKLANLIGVAELTRKIYLTQVEVGGQTIKEMYGLDVEGYEDTLFVKTKDTDEKEIPGENIIKWIKKNTSASKFKEVVAAAEDEFDSDGIGTLTPANEDDTTNFVLEILTTYPLIVSADIGRGYSDKKIKFTPDYATSKTMDNMFYSINVFDSMTQIEATTATLNPATVYNNVLYGINEDTSIQVKFANIEGAYEEFIKALAGNTNYSAAQIAKFDLLVNGTDAKGGSIAGISIDMTNSDAKFGSDYGVEYLEGDNGNFGDKPFGTDAWTEAAIKVFTGVEDPAIWDVDLYKIAAVFDANYPKTVKDAIAAFVTFREDCVYFRDYGIGTVDNPMETYENIENYNTDINPDYKNRYIADYCTTYQIYNPETKKRIKVTMMYDFARTLINHFVGGCCRPLAGFANNMILPSAIEGTVNFTPRITPTVNQKALLDDLHVNYSIFEEGQCVVQSLYSSQEAFTQLSFINNVLAIQEVMRSVRISCPKQRYTFTSGTDFSIYAAAVNNVLKLFSNNFAELYFEYEQDPLKASQKIFYASIYFRFNNWAQTESFEIYALPNE